MKVGSIWFDEDVCRLFRTYEVLEIEGDDDGDDKVDEPYSFDGHSDIIYYVVMI